MVILTSSHRCDWMSSLTMVTASSIMGCGHLMDMKLKGEADRKLVDRNDRDQEVHRIRDPEPTVVRNRSPVLYQYLAIGVDLTPDVEKKA
ncbi:unnamed protein product, partial [Brenthis ino]